MKNFFVEGIKKNFAPLKSAVSCVCFFEGKFLILKKTRVWPGMWSSPGGTIEKGEISEVCALRELFEETGLIVSLDHLEFPKKFSIRNKWGEYLLYAYLIRFAEKPEIFLNEEHSAFAWLAPCHVRVYELIPGGEQVLKIYEELCK